MQKIEIVGISGKLGTGKDYIARRYFYNRGYKQISLAWHFKVWIVGQGLATWEEVFVTKPPHVRTLLQQEGTEKGRNVYGENVWIETMIAWIRVYSEYWGVSKFIVPDVRFPNEVTAIQKAGGKVYRIIAPHRDKSSSASPEARAHPSETSLDGFPLTDFDGIIFNDPEHSSTVGMQVSKLLESPIDSTVESSHADDDEELYVPVSKVLQSVDELLEKLSDELKENKYSIEEELLKASNVISRKKLDILHERSY